MLKLGKPALQELQRGRLLFHTAHWPCPASLVAQSVKNQSSPPGSTGQEFDCNAGDLGSIPRLGRYPGEGKGYLTPVFWHGEFHVLYSRWGLTESDTDSATFTFTDHIIFLMNTYWSCVKQLESLKMICLYCMEAVLIMCVCVCVCKINLLVGPCSCFSEWTSKYVKLHLLFL